MATLLDWAKTLSASPLYLTAAIVLCLIASLVVMATWGYLWRLIRHGFPVRCWFCSGTTRVPYGNRNCFDCPHCDQYNGFDRDGAYNKDIPAMRHSAMNVHRSSSSNNNQAAATAGSSSVAALCATCNRNQALKVAQLAQFEPSSPAAEDAELAALRARLERAYALCQRCRATRRAALQAQDIRLLPGLLAWQRSRVLAQQRKGRPSTAAAVGANASGRWLLRSGAISLAIMGVAAVASAEAARLLCAPAVACLAGGLWLRHRGRGGSLGRLSVRACDLWHGPVFFASVEPLRSRLTAWLAELFAVHLGVSSLSPAWFWIPGARPSTWLFAALLAALHAVAFVLNWRLSSSTSRSVVSAVVNGSKGGFRSLNNQNKNKNKNNNSRDSNSSTSSNASNNNASFNGANSDLPQPLQPQPPPQPPPSQAQQSHYDEDNLESASLFNYNRRQVASVFQRRPLFAASHAAAPASGLMFFNSGLGGGGGGGGGQYGGRPASLPPTLISAWPPQRGSSSASLFHQHQHQQFQQPPPPPPPCTPVNHHQRPRSRSRSPSRHLQQLQSQFLPLAPSPMDVDDEMAAFANGGTGVGVGVGVGGVVGVAGDINGGGGDSAYASQRGSVADLPIAFAGGNVAAHDVDGGCGSAATARTAAAAPRSRLSQVLIGCCLGLNFSLLLHCLLLPAARAALTANGGLGTGGGVWETLIGAWMHGS